METQYRFIKSSVNIINETEIYPHSVSVYTKLSEAYTRCIPVDESKCCRMLYSGVKQEFDSGKTLISVSYVNKGDKIDVYWIQLIHGDLNEPIPKLTGGSSCCIWPPRLNTVS
jgi:hypothetical protein